MKHISFILILFSCSIQEKEIPKRNNESSDYNTLINLFKGWREFEKPSMLNGAPDYTEERFIKNDKTFKDLQSQLSEIKINDRPIDKQIDWHIIRAEMNGYDFNYRILRPWVRDPAFYQTIWMHQSDVPAHEGPTNHGVLEFWMYDLPLNNESKEKFMKEILSITPFLIQARSNLTGNAKDLWIAGIENFKQQYNNLNIIKSKLSFDQND